MRLWRRLPWAMRALLALCLGTIGLIGIADPTSSGAPTHAAAPLTKHPEQPAAGDRTVRFSQSQALVAQGRSLYENGCSSCHGDLLQGVRGAGPSLLGVGAGPVDFYVSTGRMPLPASGQEPERARPVYTRAQTKALVAFVARLGHGPAVAPDADPAAGHLSTGLKVFTENCAGCHQVVARGGLTVGAWVPSLQQATPMEIAEAVRMGPYVMPHFDSSQITQSELDSLARYVLWTRHPDNAGGWGLGNIGPIPEGIAAWFCALLAMIIVARLIGERVEDVR